MPLPAHAEVEAANDWSWLWADSARAVGELAPVVSQVDHHDRRLLDLLSHSPTASHERDGQPPTAWFGIEEGDDLLSVAAVNRQGDCTFISSVVTHRDARGRGLASIVCGHATAWALQHAPLVALGMMTDNDVAARIYTRLGFICEKRWQSARFEICD
ncbi:MAG: GNAT family N-acetyltransferase [Actinobacteria bacterium]|nr:GNAT family N-acetyltransferase [Actinomycetota bacterium]